MKSSVLILVAILFLLKTVQVLSLKTDGDTKFGINGDEMTSSTSEEKYQMNEDTDSKTLPQKKFINGWENYYKLGQNELGVAKRESSKVKRSLGYNSNDHWQYPSNLMVLLRGHGKRSLSMSPELLEILDSLQSGNGYASEPSPKRFSSYSNDYSYGAAPKASRQFLVWKDGNYILG